MRWAAALGAMLIALASMTTLSLAQNGRPEPASPPRSQPGAAPVEAPPTTTAGPRPLASTGTPPRRMPVPEGKITLTMNDVPVDDKIVQFIAENTGKVVLPINLAALKVKKITVMHTEPIERSAALDLVLTALRLNQVGISESEDIIILDDIANLSQKPVPVFTAHDDVLGLTNLGNFIVKIYRLREAAAEGVFDRLSEVKPDYATLSVDANSNQIILYADVSLAQHFQRLISELDRNFVAVKTETFRLKYADATAVSQQIYDLFENTNAAGQAGQPAQRTVRPPQRQQPGGRNVPGAVTGTPAGVSTPGPVVELRVSVNVQQNAVTVSAEPEKIEAIRDLILNQWDLPRELETFRVYVLEHTDPIKMRDLIMNMMGGGGGGSRQPGRAGQPRAGAAAGGGGAVGATGGAAISEVIGDIYRVEAYPDRNSLVVMSKTKEALDYLDGFIKANDLPSTVGLPQVVELKHANAVSLADELNVLLAEAGTGGGLDRPGSGLSAEGPGGFTEGGGGAAGAATGGGTSGRGGGPGGGGGGAAGTIEFPWQRGRARDDQSPESSLIGRVRIVPIVRQNALAVLAPVAQRQAVVELIREFDRPGRQVMISAIIAEVQLGNEFALGLRLSSSAITPGRPDNAISGTVGVEGTREGVLSRLFDTSVLDASMDVNVLIQALSERTNVRIIQEPRVFTADNEEAAFFDGQQIPFITNSVVNNQVGGGVTQSFEYKKVGVLLNVRPRITVQRDVDMEIRLALSAVVPGQTLFGGAILDLRETTTKVIVKNAQTIVLSGLLKDVDSKVSRGLPILSDIPLIGDLFRSRENSKATSELVAFITPIVVDNPSENDENFNQQERENLHRLSLPMKDQAKFQKQERERVREQMIAPKTPSGLPIPEALPEDDKDRSNRGDADRPQAQRARDPEAPIDVEDLNTPPGL